MTGTNQVAKEIKPADARAELGISVATLAKEAKLSLQVVVNGEKGRSIQRLSAHAILKALNHFRREKGLEPYRIEQIDWKIQGE